MPQCACGGQRTTSDVSLCLALYLRAYWLLHMSGWLTSELPETLLSLPPLSA